MNSRDFCYWLQGYFELFDARCADGTKPSLDEDQTSVIRRHLAMVFHHEIDPTFPERERLQEIHDAADEVKPTPAKPAPPAADFKTFLEELPKLMKEERHKLREEMKEETEKKIENAVAPLRRPHGGGRMMC